MDEKNMQINKYIIWQEWVAYKQTFSIYNTKTLKDLNLRSDINL